MKKYILGVALLLVPLNSQAHEVKTNAVYMEDAPDWITPGRVDTVVEHIQPMLE
jgi:hypothetical protein